MTAAQGNPGGLVYGRALAEAVEARGGETALRDAEAALAGVAGAWEQNLTFRSYFLASSVKRETKRSALDRLVDERMPVLVGNFLRLLLKRGRMALLPDIAEAYRALLDERLGRVPVTLTTAVPVDEVSLRTWTDRIRQAVGGEPVIRHVVQPEILAGAVIRVGDTVADGSARRRLDQLKTQIIAKGRKRHAL